MWKIVRTPCNTNAPIVYRKISNKNSKSKYGVSNFRCDAIMHAVENVQRKENRVKVSNVEPKKKL